MILDLLVSDIVYESMIRTLDRVFIFGLANDALFLTSVDTQKNQLEFENNRSIQTIKEIISSQLKHKVYLQSCEQ